MRSLAVACFIALGLLAAPVMAADTAAPLYVIVYKQGPAWHEGVPMEKQDAMGAHYRYVKQLFEAGSIVDAGPTLDEPGGVVVLKAADMDAAKAIMEADPSITQKMFVGEVHSWMRTFRSDKIPASAVSTAGDGRSPMTTAPCHCGALPSIGKRMPP